MRKLIYYPGFEVHRPEWLKFALLYIDELNPIVPENGTREWSELYWKILGETDLINPHYPSFEEGRTATLDAIDVVEKILRRPSLYSDILGKNNIRENWENKKNHKYKLFQGKFPDDWKHFCCIENNFGTVVDEGIRLPKKLALIYMTLLSQIIADRKGVSPITDDPELDKFCIFTRRADPIEQDKLEVAQTIINLKLPSNIKWISIDEIIKFRRESDFKLKLQAFHTELDKYFENVENGNSPEEFVESFNLIWKEFTDDILLTGIGAISFSLGTWVQLKSPQATTESYINQIIGAGGSFAVSGAVRIKNTWKNTKTKRYARKYLANLSRIKPSETEQV